MHARQSPVEYKSKRHKINHFRIIFLTIREEMDAKLTEHHFQFQTLTNKWCIFHHHLHHHRDRFDVGHVCTCAEMCFFQWFPVGEFIGIIRDWFKCCSKGDVVISLPEMLHAHIDAGQFQLRAQID